MLLAASLVSFMALAQSTVDVNMPELEYIANHISQAECRRLVAALHSDSYELDPRVAQTGLLLPDTTPCIDLLIHWNSSPGEGRGKTHEVVSRRLRQLGHQELAVWLSKMVFKQLTDRLDDLGLERPPCHRHKTTTEEPLTTTEVLQDIKQQIEQKWTPFDSILIVLLCLLFATVSVLSIFLCIKLISSMKQRRQPNNEYRPLYAS